MPKDFASMLEKSSIARRRSALNAPAPHISPIPVPQLSPVAVRPLQAEARWSLRVPEHDVARLKSAAGYQLDQPINRYQTRDGRTAARLGPDEWLLLAPEADAEMAAAEVSAALRGQHHSLVDVSHRNVGLTVSGPAAAATLNAGCPLDLSLDRFLPGMATRSLLGKCEIVLFRLDDGTARTEPVYRIECWRSFAAYVCAFLTEAAREFHAR
jgi:sarcosine oxidase, subunit gamma